MGINRVMRAPTMIAPVRGYATNATSNRTEIKPDQPGDSSSLEGDSRNIHRQQVQSTSARPITAEEHEDG